MTAHQSHQHHIHPTGKGHLGADPERPRGMSFILSFRDGRQAVSRRVFWEKLVGRKYVANFSRLVACPPFPPEDKALPDKTSLVCVYCGLLFPHPPHQSAYTFTQDAIAIVRHAFLTLSEYPPHRIEFLAPVTPDTKIHDITQWSKILEDAWGGIQSDPPARLKVQVVDLPGQAEQRASTMTRPSHLCPSSLMQQRCNLLIGVSPYLGARREAWRPILIVSSIIVPFFIVMAVMVILSSLDIV